jgi:predicted nucleic acid-binding protein
MPDPLRWGTTPLIADTTVWCKLRIAPQDAVEDFRAAAEQGLIIGSPVVHLEFLFHQKNGSEFDAADARFSAAPTLPLTPEICTTALDVLRELRARSAGGLHRVKAPDALVAATAAANGVNVLHDDKHYPTLAKVLDFDAVRFGPYH